MLRFRLLGPFEAFRDGERIPASAFRTRQARCLLKLLISEHDRPLAFGRLADTFWADADPATARNSVQAAVRTLRRVLEPQLSRGVASRFIVTSGDSYRFVANDAVIDTDTFFLHRTAGLEAERRGNTAAAIESYRAAIAAYGGEYIAEEPDAEWVLGTRERLREAFLDAAARLADLLLGEGRITEAVGVIERALGADPLREELYLSLMSLHARAGRRGHVLAAYERCRRILQAQLGIEPGRAIARVRDAALSGPPPAAGRENARPPTRAAAFVGREGEIAILRDAWTRSARRSGVLLTIGGEAGAGKTRLLRHFAEHLGPEGEVVWLSAHLSDSAVPLAPILAAIGTWLDGATTRDVERVGEHGAALAHLLPQVRNVWPDCPTGGAPPGDAQIFEALIAALLARAGRQRALVVLDDAHWADASMLAWLGYALRRLPPGMLVAVTARPGEGHSVSVDRLREDARREDRSVELALGPLSESDVERLVADATDAGLEGPALAHTLHAATKGNALFVVETIRDLPRATAGAAIAIPGSVRDAILARVDALPDAARDVLRGIAAAGTPVTAEVLGVVEGMQIDEVIDALDVLLARRLVQIAADGRRYAIEHPLIERAVDESIGPARREERHRRAAVALAARPPDATDSRQLRRRLVPAAMPESSPVPPAEVRANP